MAALPLRFEENRGQADPRVAYLARAAGATLFLTQEGATLVERTGEGTAAVTMRVVGAKGVAAPVPTERLPGTSSYFVGNDPSRWVTGAPSFRSVAYDDVLPGVREVFHGERGALEYDFVLSPGARPASVEVSFDGARGLSVGGAGELFVATAGGVIVSPAPRVYQRVDGQELPVSGAYRVEGEGRVAFDVGSYDEGRDLVIDPVLAYATFLGGSGSDYAYAVAVGASGAMVVAGSTTSLDFPTKDPEQAALGGMSAAFVAEIDPTGQDLVYSTYLGGSGTTTANGVAVDATGAVYVAGSTTGADFPTVGAFQTGFGGIADAFVTKLAPSGAAIAYSTYLGGSQRDYAYAIALDGAGAAYVTGSTYSDDFPTKSAAQAAFGGAVDIFATKLAASGASLTYSTYIGGNATDEGRGVAVDGTGAAYIAGYTASTDFPTAPSPPFQSLNNGDDQATVTRLSPAGSAFVYSTYLGGSQSDQAQAIAVDDAGAAYVTGSTSSPDFPTAHPAQPALVDVTGGTEGFVTKLDPTGTSLAYSTFLGGTGGDIGQGIAVDGAGDAWVTGTTGSADFPAVSPIQSDNAALANSSGTNAFLSEIAPVGSSILFSTYLGGSLGDSASAIALGAGGTAYVAGYTVSSNFPTRSPLQPHIASSVGGNAFLAAIGPAPFLPDAGLADSALPSDAGAGTSTPPIEGDASEPSAPDATVGGPLAASGGGCACTEVRGERREAPYAPLAGLVVALTVVYRRKRRLA